MEVTDSESKQDELAKNLKDPESNEVDDAAANDNELEDVQDDQTKKSAMAKWMFRYPRLMSVMCFIFLPLLVLIGVCFLFGHILAALEMPAEIAANQEALAQRLHLSSDIQGFQKVTYELIVECLYDCTGVESGYNDTEIIEDFFLTNWTEASPCYDSCTSYDRIANITTANFNEILDTIWFTDIDGLSFEWIRCAPEGYVEQYPKNFLEAAETLYAYENYVRSYMKWNQTISHEMALLAADGHPSCKANTSGGAMFWFTIMTTIGYGNTAPVTTGGRMLIYTIGFLSVLLFTAVIGQAGYVMIVVCDDIFGHTKYARQLTSGWIASLFWLICYYLWNLVLGGIAIAYSKFRIDHDFPLSEGFWYAFISTTTIGFGDYHIAHAYIKWYDLFWIPLPMLMGFVLLANFALKFSEWIWEVVGAKQMPSMGLDDILKASRTKTPGGLGGRPGVVENPRLVGNKPDA